jgi:hypothetical protein
MSLACSQFAGGWANCIANESGVILLRTIAYQSRTSGPTKGQKLKAIILAIILFAASFMAGAAVQKKSDIMQDIIIEAQFALERFKTFLNEKVFFQVDNVSSQIKWTAAITLLIIRDYFWISVRGP